MEVIRLKIVPHKALMGYLTGYSDSDYIEILQNISLPYSVETKMLVYRVSIV